MITSALQHQCLSLDQRYVVCHPSLSLVLEQCCEAARSIGVADFGDAAAADEQHTRVWVAETLELLQTVSWETLTLDTLRKELNEKLKLKVERVTDATPPPNLLRPPTVAELEAVVLEYVELMVSQSNLPQTLVKDAMLAALQTPLKTVRRPGVASSSEETLVVRDRKPPRQPPKSKRKGRGIANEKCENYVEDAGGGSVGALLTTGEKKRSGRNLRRSAAAAALPNSGVACQSVASSQNPPEEESIVPASPSFSKAQAIGEVGLSTSRTPKRGSAKVDGPAVNGWCSVPKKQLKARVHLAPALAAFMGRENASPDECCQTILDYCEEAQLHAANRRVYCTDENLKILFKGASTIPRSASGVSVLLRKLGLLQVWVYNVSESCSDEEVALNEEKCAE